MAAITLATTATVSDGAAGNSVTSGSFTPAAGDLLVAMIVKLSSTNNGTFDDTQGLGWAIRTSVAFSAGANRVVVAFADTLAAASSMTVTYDCTGDGANRFIMAVARVSGMTKTGVSAQRAAGFEANQAGATTPDPVLDMTPLSTNPILGIVGNLSNPAGLTKPAAPAEWVERLDTGNAGTIGMEIISIDSGITDPTVTWGSTSATAFGVWAVEFDSSNGGAPAPGGGYALTILRSRMRDW